MGLNSMTCSRSPGPMIAGKIQFSGMGCRKSSAAKSTPEAAEVYSTHRQVVVPAPYAKETARSWERDLSTLF